MVSIVCTFDHHYVALLLTNWFSYWTDWTVRRSEEFWPVESQLTEARNDRGWRFASLVRTLLMIWMNYLQTFFPRSVVTKCSMRENVEFADLPVQYRAWNSKCWRPGARWNVLVKIMINYVCDSFGDLKLTLALALHSHYLLFVISSVTLFARCVLVRSRKNYRYRPNH